MKRILVGFALAILLLPAASHAQTLAAVRSAHHLDCGTVEAVEDWDSETVHGDLSTMAQEICKAVAIAALGSGEALQIHSYPAENEAFDSLRTGGIQLAVGVSPGTTAAMQYRVAFGPPIYYDTQRFLVAKAAGITNIDGLRDKLICAMNGTLPQEVLNQEMAARHLPFGLQAHSEVGEMAIAVAVRRCAAGTAMETWLADARADFPANAIEFVFLPERVGLYPIVPAYRYGDQAFSLLVDWTISALIEAEALGITRDNVKDATKREDLRAARLLGRDDSVARSLGLPPEWAVNVIAATGNYGEIFERTVGKPLRLERGPNALWTQGGLMRPLPMQ